MPKAFDRCVKKVKAKGGVKNPHAVCRKAMGSDKEIKARDKRKKSRSK